METKEQIIQVANQLLIERGYNAFSYKNIAEQINIKTSSIHYHFPSKNDLGIAVIQLHYKALKNTINKNIDKTPLEKMQKLLLYYKKLVQNENVCIMGALTSDVNTLEESLRTELLNFANAVVAWAAEILEAGIKENIFKPIPNSLLKAKLLISNLMALVQIARIERDKDSFDQLSQGLLLELLIN